MGGNYNERRTDCEKALLLEEPGRRTFTGKVMRGEETAEQAQVESELEFQDQGPVSDNQDEKVGGIRIRVLNALMIVMACIVSLVFLQAVQQTNDAYNELEAASSMYIECTSAANDMKDASNYLTSQVRSFVITKDPEYLANYFEEAVVKQRREQAVDTIAGYLEGQGPWVALERALEYSNELMEPEYYAMKLIVEAEGIDLTESEASLGEVQLTPEDEALSREEKVNRAIELVFNEEYLDQVALIEENVVQCREELMDSLVDAQQNGSEEMHELLFRQQVLTWALLAVAIGLILMVIAFILWPLQHNIVRIKENEPLPMVGAYEMRFLAKEYNTMYEENLRNHDQLRRKAEHDHLTGLYNRSVFEKLLYAYREEPIALMLIDADYFKEVNDTYGHDVGDATLRKIAQCLNHTFRSSDYACRIGGDEFAVVMTAMDDSLKDVVTRRVTELTDALGDTSDGLPAMTLSVGIAFSGTGMPAEDLYKHADEALYKVKDAGRNGHRFYGDE